MAIEQTRLRLRHVALVTGRFDDVVEDVRAVLGVEVCFTHEDMVEQWGPELIDEFGIASANFPIGDTFLEVISPLRPGTRAGRYLNARGGDTGYMTIIQTSDLERSQQRARQLDIREVWQGGVDGIRTSHLHPRDTGGSLLSLDEPADPTDWPWAGPNWRDAIRTDVTTEIVAVEVETTRPDEVCTLWGELLDCPVSERDGGPTVSLDRGEVRFRPTSGSNGEGVIAITVASVDPDHVRRLAATRGQPADARGRVLIGGVWFEPVLA